MARRLSAPAACPKNWSAEMSSFVLGSSASKGRELFREHAFFKGRSPKLFELMAPHMSVKIFSPGDVIIHEGDEGDCMFFMYSGEVEVLIGHKDKEKQVATLGVGSLFGEMAVFGNGIREATVRALKICGCHIIYDKDLHDCLKGFPTERVHLHMLASLRSHFP